MLSGHSAPQTLTCDFVPSVGTRVAFSPDGQLFSFSGGRDAMLFERATARLIGKLDHDDRPLRSAFAPDGSRMANARHHSRILVWNFVTNQIELEFETGHRDAISALAVAPDGEWLCTGSHDGDVSLFDLGTGRRRALLSGHQGSVSDLVISPDARWIATAGTDATVRIWDARTGREERVLRGHGAPVTSLAFSADGKRLITGGVDRTVAVWRSDDGAQLLKFYVGTAGVTSLGIAADHRHLTVLTSDGRVSRWKTPLLAEIAGAEASVASGQELSKRLAQARQEREEEAIHQRASDPGVLRHWLILGPIALGYTRDITLLQRAFIEENSLRPQAGTRASAGSADLVWQAWEAGPGGIDFASVFGRKVDYSVAYAVSYVYSPTEQNGVTMHVGSDDGALVYLNGRKVYESEFRRSFILDEDAVEDISLNHGVNVVVFKIINFASNWAGSLRFSHPDGSRIEGLRDASTPPTASTGRLNP
jgi:hypothetical protein